jgi:quercetin dioxygenase-like cupin family protein
VERFSAWIQDEPAPGWTAVADGVQVRHMVEGNGCSISLYRIGPGRRFERHGHPFPELGVLLAGRGRLLIGDEERKLREGDSFYVPGGLPHGFVVAPGGPVVVMNVTCPLPPYVPGPPFSELVRLAKRTVRIDLGTPDSPPRGRTGAQRRED